MSTRNRRQIIDAARCEITFNFADGSETQMSFAENEYHDAADMAQQVLWVERITGKTVTSAQAVWVFVLGE